MTWVGERCDAGGQVTDLTVVHDALASHADVGLLLTCSTCFPHGSVHIFVACFSLCFLYLEILAQI